MHQNGDRYPAGLPRKKLGLALGGGGARGLAHIGVLKVFDRERISVDAVAGSSMGGIVGALYCAGLSAMQIEREALALTRSKRALTRLIDLRLRSDGLVGGQRIADLFAHVLGTETTFADLRIPFAATGVDLFTGREVNLTKGNVVQAVRATMSIPGVFAPVDISPYRLVDGGVLNNLPVDVAYQLGVDTVIAIDVMPNFRANQPGQPPIVAPLQAPGMPALYSSVWQVVTVMMSALTEARLQRTPPALILRPDLPLDIDVLLGFERAREIIAAGERAAEAMLNEIRLLPGMG